MSIFPCSDGGLHKRRTKNLIATTAKHNFYTCGGNGDPLTAHKCVFFFWCVFVVAGITKDELYVNLVSPKGAVITLT